MAVFLVGLDAEALGGVLEGLGGRAFNCLGRPDLRYSIGLVLGGDIAELEYDALGILGERRRVPPEGFGRADVVVAQVGALNVKHCGYQSFEFLVVAPCESRSAPYNSCLKSPSRLDIDESNEAHRILQHTYLRLGHRGRPDDFILDALQHLDYPLRIYG